jgi:hypothetical protein
MILSGWADGQHKSLGYHLPHLMQMGGRMGEQLSGTMMQVPTEGCEVGHGQARGHLLSGVAAQCKQQSGDVPEPRNAPLLCSGDCL